ncbi:PAAR domain-containing protein [Burkholderia cenocepacia]|uniref:PAAR domain-containing protein n=1 Tax=Burkholderia cenocepacia TaxID=95486 RepID=UPI002AB7E43B|nr:PAAR domain-containing protein [Burkholderia cenocepacia]
MYAFIREGDTTSHGGRVLVCTSTNMMFGKPVALLGDMVACPKCGGVFPIVDVKISSMTFDGRPVATDGDKTACGASLIASLGSAHVQQVSGAAGGIGGGKSVVPQQDSTPTDRYRGRFQVIDEKTGSPVPNHPYSFTSSDGSTVMGTTDAAGFTQWHEGSEPASLRFQSSSGND